MRNGRARRVILMNDIHDKIVKDLIRDEGLRLKPYRCTAGKLTIGIGRNIEDKGITESEARYLLNQDIFECKRDLESLFTNQVWMFFPEDVIRVFVNMRFQLGGNGFRKFKRMITAARMHNWNEVARQMRDSRWYRQTTNRAERLIVMIERLQDGDN